MHHHYLRIVRPDGRILKEVQLTQYGHEVFIYKWSKIEEEGGYSFLITGQPGSEIGKNVSFAHTAPFSKIFEAYVTNEEAPKVISGFREGEDILVVYNRRLNNFTLKRMKFTRFVVDTRKYGFFNPKKVEMPSAFNNWNVFAETFIKKDENIFETTLALDDGIYEYKLVIDGTWMPHGENEKLVVGEIGFLFPNGELGNGHFVNDAKSEFDERKAIKHNKFDLNFLNKVSENIIEVKIRTQKNDVEKVILHVSEENDIEEIFEMERMPDESYGFDYFRKIIKLRINPDKFKYYFELIDGGVRGVYSADGFEVTEKNDIDIKYIEVDYNKEKYPVFMLPEWAKRAVWYNIFPERFYNGDTENDPIYNQFGPEVYEKPDNKEKADLIPDYRWGIADKTYGKFDCNSWTSDFEVKESWEKLYGMDVNYSLKYARMYGGDLAGIKKKIPYLKELGINAVWLNPVFFSDSNHKYGASDFRHISPDFGTIKTSGSTYGVKIDKNNPYGCKSYVDVLGEKAKNNSELKLLKLNLVGENRGKNGYLETEDPATWVWTESDLIMVDLIKELHKNEIRVIFDGVFNHSGPSHWSFEMVMLEGEKSKYKNWYKFHDFTKFKPIDPNLSEEEAYKIFYHNKNKVNYSGWYGFRDLPEFNTYNTEFMEYIFNITKKWMLGPDGVTSDNWQENDGIDGWRLDVPNCVENQNFWHIWRGVVKGANKDGYITAELWGDARAEINDGQKYDTVMNYEWLKTTVAHFISQGKEFDKRYRLKPSEFMKELKIKRNWYPLQALQVSQNLNGSHDTDRLLSRIVNDELGRDLEEGKQIDRGYNTIRPDLAGDDDKNTTINWKEHDIKPKEILKLISIFQMTYVGAPMIYYGDEVGMWGATDPYCRKPMLWPEYKYDDETDGTPGSSKGKYSVEPDMELLEWYKKIIRIRTENEILSVGEFKELYVDDERDITVFARYDEDNYIITVLNNSLALHKGIEIETIPSGEYIELLTGEKYLTDNNGSIFIDVKEKSGMILKKIK